MASDAGSSSFRTIRMEALVDGLNRRVDHEAWTKVYGKAVKERGGDIPGMPNVAKLSMSQIVRLTRDLGLRIAGPAGMLHAYDSDDKAALKHATGDPFAGSITEMALFAQAPPIYGGTDQVQRNIIGERVLGLPKEPSNDRVTPFSQLPKNA